jgi:putative endonuclease
MTRLPDCTGRLTVTVRRQKLGKSGEDLAVTELERRGYAIVARRYRTACGEIDIVAEDGETLVFVEVKARATAEFGTAAEAVTRRKQLQLVRMARDFLARTGVGQRPCRFDVVAIDDVETAPVVVVYRHAFDAA